ncbi:MULTISPECIES: hypothetical protein [unclassified Polaromonas]|uniref:hypothetical protein n=1 Tax=unclassified Polaromonas TaxID=2638319 RepID=UPI0025F86AAD|nr:MULTISPECIES: hypothetical protein [unclassified Polaromonas]
MITTAAAPLSIYAKAAIAIAALGCLLAIGYAFKATYEAGQRDGTATCESKQTKSNEKQQVKANVKTKKDLKRAADTGNAQELGRAAVEHVFDQLAKDAKNETADPFDSCVLPDPRVRKWNAANAGRLDPADQGGTAGKPDAGAAGPAALDQRGGAAAGSQSPGGGQGLPPAGDANVQPAGLSGGTPR